jgi:hypothetical protein
MTTVWTTKTRAVNGGKRATALPEREEVRRIAQVLDDERPSARTKGPPELGEEALPRRDLTDLVGRERDDDRGPAPPRIADESRQPSSARERRPVVDVRRDAERDERPEHRAGGESEEQRPHRRHHRRRGDGGGRSGPRRDEDRPVGTEDPDGTALALHAIASSVPGFQA